MIISIIAAMANHRVIGINNSLPWKLPSDMKWFRQHTLGKPIVMGRKTFDSIGRPLPGRTNIVITRQPDYAAEGVRVVSSLADALALAEDIALIDGASELMVIGGAEIYRAAMVVAKRLYLTEVHARVEGDAYLPEVDWAGWREVSRESWPATESNPYPYSFVVFERL